MRSYSQPLAALIVALGPQVSTAWAAGSVADGRALAETWCSSCHMVGPEQATAPTAAPTFESIAERLPDEMAALAAFLADPHPPMPQMSLSRQEIRNLLAYLASLR